MPLPSLTYCKIGTPSLFNDMSQLSSGYNPRLLSPWVPLNRLEKPFVLLIRTTCSGPCCPRLAARDTTVHASVALPSLRRKKEYRKKSPSLSPAYSRKQAHSICLFQKRESHHHILMNPIIAQSASQNSSESSSLPHDMTTWITPQASSPRCKTTV